MTLPIAFRFLLLAILLFSSGASSAQQGGGIISGHVTDMSGATIGGAIVTLANAATQQALQLKTNRDGNFSSPSLPLGLYSVQITQSGFRPERRDGVTVEVDARLEVNFSLGVGDVNENVNVSTESVQVNVESTELGTVFSNRPIQDLPVNGRSVLALAQLTPGVTSNAGPTNKGFADRGSLVASISSRSHPSRSA